MNLKNVLSKYFAKPRRGRRRNGKLYVPGTTKPSAKRAADVSNYNTR